MDRNGTSQLPCHRGGLSPNQLMAGRMTSLSQAYFPYNTSIGSRTSAALSRLQRIESVQFQGSIWNLTLPKLKVRSHYQFLRGRLSARLLGKLFRGMSLNKPTLSYLVH